MSEMNAKDLGYVVVTDYVKANTGEDLADALQNIIDSNPRRTIYFPDGVYTISKPLCTSSDAQYAVSLSLSNFAIIKAAENWSSDEAMIRLGALNKKFTIWETGTNYFLAGGCIDGSGIAKGVSIDGGRETCIRNLSIKFVTQGLNIKYNKEYGSNDADIENVHIVGMNLPGSIGVICDGFDNTLSDMRVAGFEVGIKLGGAGNFLRYLHNLYIYDQKYDYKDSIGFWDVSGGNWYDVCYPDNFAVGFRTSGHTMSTYTDCYAYWYSNRGDKQVGFMCDGKFNSLVRSYRVDLRGDVNDRSFFKCAEAGGGGAFDHPMFDINLDKGDDLGEHLSGRIIWRK